MTTAIAIADAGFCQCCHLVNVDICSLPVTGQPQASTSLNVITPGSSR